MNMKYESQENLAIAKGLASAARFGQISYEEAKKKAQPYLDKVNAKGSEIAKKFGKRFTPIQFSKLVR